MSYSPVSIDEAKQIAEAHGLQQIVIWTWNDGVGQHVTTWGEPLKHSLLAAEAGNHVKVAAGWPTELAKALPQSLADVYAEFDRSVAKLIENGAVEKSDALGVLSAFRHVLKERDPEFVKDLRPEQSIAATKGANA